jgi:hypothetical protein
LIAIAATVTALAGLVLAAPASAAVSPVADRASTAVTADALPTVQIDSGVVWSQAIVGNTVYAGGSFSNTRPAGAAPGTDLTPRGNLLAYDITTGDLVTSFAPNLNGQVKTVVASPDGSRIYVGGSFTTADGQNRYRLAAYDTTTGALVASFAPVLDATVNSITATNTTVYAGGIFGTANGVARTRLAAFSASTGALLAWNPTADNTVDAVQLTPDDTKVVVGGAFAKLNSTAALGLGAVDATTGATLPWAVNKTVKDYGSQGAILSLSTDGTSVYGTGYAYTSPSNFEGVFSADPSTGAINWLADCHGDSYGAYGSGSTVYVVSHEHYCGNIGGFPDTNPRTAWYRTTAFTAAATGTVLTNGESGSTYGNFAGQPSPSLTTWFPTIDAGTFTGQDQGSWTVTGNGQYVVEGGEFQHVNGVAQDGLVRFAVPSIAPDKIGPQDATTDTTPTVTAASSTTAKVSWLSNWDADNEALTYNIYRTGASNTVPVYSVVANSEFWNRPTLKYTDTGLTPGTSYTYWLKVVDTSGNLVRSANVTVTTAAG